MTFVRKLVPESELEPVNCPECGSDNVLTAPESCTDCAKWREALRAVEGRTDCIVCGGLGCEHCPRA